MGLALDDGDWLKLILRHYGKWRDGVNAHLLTVSEDEIIADHAFRGLLEEAAKKCGKDAEQVWHEFRQTGKTSQG